MSRNTSQKAGPSRHPLRVEFLEPRRLMSVADLAAADPLPPPPRPGDEQPPLQQPPGGDGTTTTSTDLRSPTDPNAPQLPPPDPSALPNLVAHPATPTTPLRAGAPGQINVFASNPTAVPANTSVKLFLSRDTIPGNTDDILIGGLDAVALPAGTQGQNIGAASVNVPAGTAAGRYFVISVIDPGRTVAETIERDNVSVSPESYPVGGPAGATAVRAGNLRVSTPSVVAGGTVTLTTDLTNTSTFDSDSAPILVFLSPGPRAADGDPLVGRLVIPSIPAGATISVTTDLAIPAGTRPASYFVSGLPLAPDTAATTPVPLLSVTASPIRPGGLNTGFGSGGVAASTLAGLRFSAVDTIINPPDGKLIVTGTGADAGFVVLRFNVDGSLDSSFGSGAGYVSATTGSDDERATAVTLQFDGKILVAGVSDGDFTLVRFNADGTVDSSFGTGGIVTTDVAPLAGADESEDTARDVAFRRDGRIFVVGSADASGTNDFAVVRYNANGSLDTSFDVDGLALIDFAGGNDSASSITIQPDGNAVVAGSATDAAGVTRFAAARFNDTGALDPRFASAGKLTFSSGGTNERLLAIRTQGDGKLVVGGYSASGSIDGGDLRANLYLARLTRDGALDTTFGTRGEVKTAIPDIDFGAVNDLVITPEGKIVAAAKTAEDLNDARNGKIGVSLTRYTSAGRVDTAFDSDGFLTVSRPDGGAPGPVSRPAPGDDDDLESLFDSFATASVGLVSITEGGGILTIATTANEDDESSTDLAVVSVVSDGPDLVSTLADPTIPDAVVAGAAGKVTLTITNSGTTTLKASVPVTLYLSTSSVRTDADTQVLSKTISVNLKPGKAKKVTLKFTFPNSLPDGAYFVIADVNAAGTVTEIDTTNSDAASTAATTVAAPFVDLGVAYNTAPPTTITAGRSNSTTLTITNTGNVTSTGRTNLRLFRSADLTLDDTDTELLSTLSSLKLKPNQSTKVVLKFTPTATGTPEYLVATVTYTSTPTDPDATNNTAFSTTPATFT